MFYITWLTTIRQDLITNNLSLNKAVSKSIIAQNRLLCLHLAHYALLMVHVTKELVAYVFCSCSWIQTVEIQKYKWNQSYVIAAVLL